MEPNRTRKQPPGWMPVAGVLGVLTVSNVISNRVLPDWSYLPWNLMVTVLLVGWAVRIDRRTSRELGLGSENLGRGVRVGGLLFAGMILVYAFGLAWPATRGLFEDERVGEASAWSMAYQVLVRIPLGTVVLEEVAFRGVLLAMLMARTSVIRAVLGSSLAFGLWHVLPAIGIEETNPVFQELFGGPAGAVVAVVAAVAGTAVAGLLFTAFRFLGRHLASPIIAHIASNSLGFLAAWSYLRWR